MIKDIIAAESSIPYHIIFSMYCFLIDIKHRVQTAAVKFQTIVLDRVCIAMRALKSALEDRYSQHMYWHFESKGDAYEG